MVSPLDGITVLDLTRLLPGPFATQLLADLGAEVIKIEDPALGDYMRAVPPAIDNTSYPFLMVNRNKKSLAVDLKEREGQEIVRKLVRRADVFVEQFRPGVTKRLGVEYARIRRINRRIVYCSHTGYGQTGPYAGFPGHDLNFEALAGLLSVSRDAMPAIPAVPISDLSSGFMAAFAILAALRTRDRTGTGEFIDVSIFDVSVSLMVLNIARYLGAGEEPTPSEIIAGHWPFYNLYETADRLWLTVAAVEPKFWRRLVDLLGLPELAGRQFVDVPERDEVTARMRARFREKPRAEWLRILDPKDLPVTPVQKLADAMADPQVAARGLLTEANLGGLGRRIVLAHPAKYTRTRVVPARSVPEMGADTERILRSIGYSRTRVADLFARGVVVGPRASPRVTFQSLARP